MDLAVGARYRQSSSYKNCSCRLGDGAVSIHPISSSWSMLKLIFIFAVGRHYPNNDAPLPPFEGDAAMFGDPRSPEHEDYYQARLRKQGKQHKAAALHEERRRQEARRRAHEDSVQAETAASAAHVGGRGATPNFDIVRAQAVPARAPPLTNVCPPVLRAPAWTNYEATIKQGDEPVHGVL